MGRLHGAVDFQTIPDESREHRFGLELNHIMSFRAHFDHGILDGPVQLYTLVTIDCTIQW